MGGREEEVQTLCDAAGGRTLRRHTRGARRSFFVPACSLRTWWSARRRELKGVGREWSVYCMGLSDGCSLRCMRQRRRGHERHGLEIHTRSGCLEVRGGSTRRKREECWGDFYCVDDLTADVFNRPSYRNEGGALLAGVLAQEGWTDGWRVQQRKPTESGMTHWTAGQHRPSGSRIDRVYVSPAMRRRVVTTTPVPCPFSDHAAVVTRIAAAGAKKNKVTKRFMVNIDLAKSNDGRLVAQEAILDTMEECSMLSPTERWCRVKQAIAHALRTLAVERAQWTYQELCGSGPRLGRHAIFIFHLGFKSTRNRTNSPQSIIIFKLTHSKRSVPAATKRSTQTRSTKR